MDETTKYMELMSNVRALLVSPEDALTGGVTLSAETVLGINEEDLPGFIELNFGTFLRCLRVLPAEDQELLIGYFILRKPQYTLAKLFGYQQTIASMRIRSALKTLASYIMYGEPTEANMAAILTNLGYEDRIPGVRLSKVYTLFKATGSMSEVARILKVRGNLLTSYKTIRDELLNSEDHRKSAVGQILDLNRRGKRRKLNEIRMTAPEGTGLFRHQIKGIDWNDVFFPQAVLNSGVA